MSGSGSALQHKAMYERIYNTTGIRDEDEFYRWIGKIGTGSDDAPLNNENRY